MATDPKTAYDHPANLLRSAARDSLPVAQHYTTAADALTLYEDVHDVTFAALDNQTLARVRSLYTTDPLAPDWDRPVKLRPDEFIDAVRDLLGLDD